MQDHRISAVIAASLALSPALRAADRHVFAGQSIQAAIDLAQDGDRVLVHPGTYPEFIAFRGKGIEVRSTGGPGVTTLDAMGLYETVVLIDGARPKGARLVGLRLRKGNASIAGGELDPALSGGIWAFADAGPTIERCIVENCVGFVGGGIGVKDASVAGDPARVVKLVECTVRNNVANEGGGVFGNFIDAERCRFELNIAGVVGGGMSIGAGGGLPPLSLRLTDCEFFANRALDFATGGGLDLAVHSGGVPATFDGIFTRCRFTSNSAGISGGGLSIISDPASTFVIGGCTFRNNSSAQGGAVRIAGFGGAPVAAATITACIFANDVASTGPRGVSVEGPCTLTRVTMFGDDVLVGQGALTVSDSIVRGGVGLLATTGGALAVDHSNVEGGIAGTGNVDLPPGFANAIAGDFHLVATSACIDLGGGAAGDFEGDAAVNAADLGADEFAIHQSIVGNPTPGAPVTLRINLPPASGPVLVFASGALLETPIVSPFGPFSLASPVFVGAFGPPSADGIVEAGATLPASASILSAAYCQSFVSGAERLTNVAPVVVR